MTKTPTYTVTEATLIPSGAPVLLVWDGTTLLRTLDRTALLNVLFNDYPSMTEYELAIWLVTECQDAELVTCVEAEVAQPVRATAHFEMDTRKGVTAKFVRFIAQPHAKVLWQQAWDVAFQRYGLTEGKGWRLVADPTLEG